MIVAWHGTTLAHTCTHTHTHVWCYDEWHQESHKHTRRACVGHLNLHDTVSKHHSAILSPHDRCRPCTSWEVLRLFLQPWAKGTKRLRVLTIVCTLAQLSKKKRKHVMFISDFIQKTSLGVNGGWLQEILLVLQNARKSSYARSNFSPRVPSP